jgi:hypothetical protein
MHCSAFFYRLLIAIDSYMHLLSSSNVESSNPLWNDIQSVSPLEEQEIEKVEAMQPTPSGKPTGWKCRTKFFAEKEDKLLCELWLEVSLDGAQSNEQHWSMYWERIHAYYYKHKTFESKHSMKSMMNWWGIILECTNRFCGAYTQIENRRESGKNEQDRVCSLHPGMISVLLVRVHVACMFNSHIHLCRYWMPMNYARK